MSSLADLIEPLKREIAVPGEFETVFPNTTDDDLLAALADGIAEAQLDGYFQTSVLDTADYTVTPDVSRAGGALIVLYTGMRILRAQLRQFDTATRYKAGNVEYETGKGVNLLRDELALLVTRKRDLLSISRSSGRAVYMLDGYYGRLSADWAGLGGFLPAELTRA